MTSPRLGDRLAPEIMQFIDQCQSVQLATLNPDGTPLASYAPVAVLEQTQCFYVLISELGQHTRNLLSDNRASILLIEDESRADNIYARKRLSYSVEAAEVIRDSPVWQLGISALAQRHGERVYQLTQLSDFRLFALRPMGGRYVKGFGKAFALEGGTLGGERIEHLRPG